MPLTIAPANVNLKILKILTDAKTKKHLESLGITIDATLRIISESGGNPIIEIKDGRLALDRNIANRIIVVVEGGE